MDRQVATRDGTAQTAALWEQVLVAGDLERLSSAQRLELITSICESVGLNAATRPFEYIRLNNKLTLYARKDATDQLRRIHNVSLVDIKEHDDPERGIHIVWATVRMPDGREDRDMGAVSTKGLSGDALVNALMKCVTKAKRRATLSICGLGFLDETELETIPNVQPVAEPQPEPVRPPQVMRGQIGPSVGPQQQYLRNRKELEEAASLADLSASYTRMQEEYRQNQMDQAQYRALYDVKEARKAILLQPVTVDPTTGEMDPSEAAAEESREF